MADHFEIGVKTLRLAQQLAKALTASDVPAEEWPKVLALLRAIVAPKLGPPSQIGGAERPLADDGKD